MSMQLQFHASLTSGGIKSHFSSTSTAISINHRMNKLMHVPMHCKLIKQVFVEDEKETSWLANTTADHPFLLYLWVGCALYMQKLSGRAPNRAQLIAGILDFAIETHSPLLLFVYASNKGIYDFESLHCTRNRDQLGLECKPNRKYKYKKELEKQTINHFDLFKPISVIIFLGCPPQRLIAFKRPINRFTVHVHRFTIMQSTSYDAKSHSFWNNSIKRTDAHTHTHVQTHKMFGDKYINAFKGNDWFNGQLECTLNAP